MRFCFAVFSVAILFLILAFFLRFKQSGSELLDPMQADAYGMFLVHYPIALWLQYWLFDYDLPAIVKAAIGFVLTVAFSWALTRGVAARFPARRGCCDVARHSEASDSDESGISRAPDLDCFASLPAMTIEVVTTPCRSYRPAASSRTPT